MFDVNFCHKIDLRLFQHRKKSTVIQSALNYRLDATYNTCISELHKCRPLSSRNRC